MAFTGCRFLALVAVPAVAQTPTATTPVRVAGEIEKLDGNDLMINTKDCARPDAAPDRHGVRDVFRPVLWARRRRRRGARHPRRLTSIDTVYRVCAFR